MEIINRFVMEDGTNGYTVDDCGLELHYAELGLYDPMVLTELTKAGYKIMGYYGNILTPQGVSIKDLVTVPCTVTDHEYNMMLQMAEAALTEAEAAPYFCREIEVQEVELKQPKVEIHTRKELLTYLDKYMITRKCKTIKRDIRPLNSFVAKEALFELSELTDPQVRRYMNIIEERRILGSYVEYERLKDFLTAEGVLQAGATADDVKQAYLAWGICGIKTPITSVNVNIGTNADIYSVIENLSLAKGEGCESLEMCLVDRRGILHYSKGEIDLHRLGNDYSLAGINILYEKDVKKALERTSSWETDCIVTTCGVPISSKRSYYKFMDSTGIAYTAKVDNGKVVIFDRTCSIYAANFLLVRNTNKELIPISRCNSEAEFNSYCLIRAKVYDMIKARTVESPVKSTIDLCISEGVSPENAIAWAATCIKRNPGLNQFFEASLNYQDAALMYREGPEQKFIKKYNPDELEYSTMDELTEIMKNTRQEYIDRGEYLVVDPKDVTPAGNLIKEEIILRPIEMLEFAKGILDGEMSVNHIESGKVQDGQIKVDELSKLVINVLSIMGIDLKNTSMVENALRNLDSSNVFEVDSIFKERSATYYGYLKDRAMLNAARAAECSNAVYITKIFREMANLPIEEQRHYMFECITLDLMGKKRNPAVGVQNAISEAIVTSVKASKNIPYEFKEIYSIEAPSAALKVMFSIMLGQVKVIGETLSGVIIAEKLNINGDAVEIQFSIPKDVYEMAGDKKLYQFNKLVTLCDWCQWETTNGAWNLYCLNANITPWYVTPKQGVSIPTYNFQVNFVLNKVLGGLPAEFKNELEVANAKVTELSNVYDSYKLLGDDGVPSMDFNESNIELVISTDEEETPELYNKRFNIYRTKASLEGKYVKRIRLKSDVIFQSYEKFSPSPMNSEDDEFAVLTDPELAKQTLKTYQVAHVDNGSKIKRLETNQNSYGVFNLKEQLFTDVLNWGDLFQGKFVPSRETFVIDSKLYVIRLDGTKKIFDLRDLSREALIKLTEKGLCYQLSARRFLFSTIDGYYYVEAKNA